MQIAHFSDLHLLCLDGVRWRDFANKRCIGGLNLLVNRGQHYQAHVFEAMVADINASGVDHVVCTGDVTNLALEPEFHFARKHFDALALGPDHVTVIPGNHDAYVGTGPELFAATFADYHRADNGWQYSAGSSVWPVVRVRGPVAIIGLSTSVQTPWFTAYGKIDADQVERVRAVLASELLADKLRLVAIHHPPAGPAARNRVRGLHDWRALTRMLAEVGAELVLHGHEHRDLRYTLPGPGGKSIPVLGIQAGTYEGDKPHRTARYRIFKISDQAPAGGRPQVLGHRLRMWDAGTARFVDDRPDCGQQSRPNRSSSDPDKPLQAA